MNGKKKPKYLGSWTLPSGNSADVYLTAAGVSFRWDQPPSPAWSAEDLEHYQTITFPEVLRAVATATGQRVLGVSP